MATIKELSGLFKGRSKRLEVVHVVGVDTEASAAVGEVAAEALEVQQPASEPGASATVTPAAAPVAAPPPVKLPAPKPKPQPAPVPPVAVDPPEPKRKTRRM